ncbi:MAG: FAD-binding protein [Oscillospiraceae bacterium]|nr:FAD-binding protein [Oscillospiraceae bacterium]
MFQITNNCVGCHNCYSECPMQAIDWVGNKYEIDQDKCVQCGLCAKVCHTASIIDTEADLTVPAHDRTILEADVVVCGAGTGLVGAVRAAQQGKKVIVLEKSSKLGGNTDYAHAYFPVYTKWHEEAGMPDVRENAIQHYLNVTNHVLDEGVVRTAVYGTGEFFDWLCTLTDCHQVYNLVNLGDADAHGPIYGPGLLDFPNRIRDNLNCRDDAIGPGWGGTFVKYTMLETIEREGLPVEIYTETAAEHLLLDDNGAICGVLARDPGGEVQINAPVVVLATGGFGKNDDLIREFKPWFFEGETKIHRFSVPGDTGDGILMLRELGVEPDPDRLNVSMFGPKHHPFSNVLADIALEPEMLQINLNGKRWIDETGHLFGMTPQIHFQPAEVSWAIQSRDVYEMIADRTISNPAFASKASLYKTWEEELKEEAELPIPPCATADTLEELARKIGMNPDTLVETVRRYNEFCAKGVDEDFGKPADKLLPVSDHGPYYAVRGQRFSEASLGGLMVDGQCRVLRNDGSFIPGLYGVGDATSAMHINGTLAVISELTWGVASSFASGNNAVSYIDEKAGA